jgi:hypothetical protein
MTNNRNFFTGNAVCSDCGGGRGDHMLYMDDGVNKQVIANNRTWAKGGHGDCLTRKGNNKWANNQNNGQGKPAGYGELVDEIIAGAKEQGGWTGDTSGILRSLSMNMTRLNWRV